MRAGIVAVLALIVVCLPASHAQDDQPRAADVMVHYRAFQDAYDVGDLAAAETAARAALAAHEATEPVDEIRAILAVNVAIVLLESGQGVPAQVAVAAVRALPADAASVDPILLLLMQAHADLLADPQAGLRAAVEVLEDGPFSDDALARRALFLAQAAGRAAFEVRDFDRAEAAWRAFLAHTHAGDLPEPYLRGRGLTALGAALVIDGRDGAAHGAFSEATALLAPFAAETPSGPMTPGQAAYAEALAWRAATRAKMQSLGRRPPRDDELAWPPAIAGLPAPCGVEFVPSPMPRFPSSAASRGAVGAAVLRYSLNEAGDLSDLEVVAFVPHPDFAASVEAVVDQWSVTIEAPEVGSTCRIARHGAFVSVVFSFAG